MGVPPHTVDIEAGDVVTNEMDRGGYQYVVMAFLNDMCSSEAGVGHLTGT